MIATDFLCHTNISNSSVFIYNHLSQDKLQVSNSSHICTFLSTVIVLAATFKPIQNKNSSAVNVIIVVCKMFHFLQNKSPSQMATIYLQQHAAYDAGNWHTLFYLSNFNNYESRLIDLKKFIRLSESEFMFYSYSSKVMEGFIQTRIKTSNIELFLSSSPN